MGKHGIFLGRQLLETYLQKEGGNFNNSINSNVEKIT